MLGPKAKMVRPLDTSQPHTYQARRDQRNEQKQQTFFFLFGVILVIGLLGVLVFLGLKKIPYPKKKP